ncbi:MAG: M23 family metallopeptidase [Ruminococcus sp.]|nr:M23 family metallopeptidase [Ruminococcus sp.]
MFSDNNMKKSSKGFYTALGISAVMIGSACYFAYDQGQKLKEQPSQDKVISVPEAPVINRSTGIPRVTAPVLQTTVPVRTTSVHTAKAVTTAPVRTLPASEIILTEAVRPDTPPVVPDNPPIQVTAEKLENAKPPLADVSNVLEPFSGTELVKSSTTGYWQTHNGTDIAAEVGAEVYSVSSGEVVDVSNDPLWGVTVTVDHHNGFVSKYCSLGSDLSVQKGDTVASGQLIGAVSQTADIESASDPHLHIELKHHDSFIDPMSAFPSE